MWCFKILLIFIMHFNLLLEVLWKKNLHTPGLFYHEVKIWLKIFFSVTFHCLVLRLFFFSFFLLLLRILVTAANMIHNNLLNSRMCLILVAVHVTLTLHAWMSRSSELPHLPQCGWWDPRMEISLPLYEGYLHSWFTRLTDVREMSCNDPQGVKWIKCSNTEAL